MEAVVDEAGKEVNVDVMVGRGVRLPSPDVNETLLQETPPELRVKNWLGPAAVPRLLPPVPVPVPAIVT